MTSFFSKFRRQSNSSPRLLDDNEKAAAFEQDPTRPTNSAAGSRGSPRLTKKRLPLGHSLPQSQRKRYIGSFAPNPLVLNVIRFFLYGLTSLSALATAAVGLAVVAYYNSHGPVIKPSWGSLIAVIVFGIGTPGVLFGLFFVTPFLFRPGTVGAILNQTRIELIMLFNLCVVWISGALAFASDLRGTEYCLWDGYWHYPKPSDFGHVCNLINVDVALAYTTFGLAALQMVVFYTWAIYVLLYLDQEALTEPTNDLGGRAYRAHKAALASYRAETQERRRKSASIAGPRGGSPTTGEAVAGPAASGGFPASRTVPSSARDDVEAGPAGGGVGAGGEGLGLASDVDEGSGYYGYERSSRAV
ncbi:hypothetical protein MNV49_002285 [Pseudohyphozyma bogoriensis]|nr:hypothetical protein MNV49_002285 [Pseudohyphozyma bogoriensis]